MARNCAESRGRCEPVREQPLKFTLEQPAEGHVGGAGAFAVIRRNLLLDRCRVVPVMGAVRW